MAPKSPPAETIYLRLRDVLKILPVARSTFYAWVASGKAPRGRKLSPGVTVWSRAQILALLED